MPDISAESYCSEILVSAEHIIRNLAQSVRQCNGFETELIHKRTDADFRDCFRNQNFLQAFAAGKRTRVNRNSAVLEHDLL